MTLDKTEKQRGREEAKTTSTIEHRRTEELKDNFLGKQNNHEAQKDFLRFLLLSV
jgi:hypothetical protein